MKKWTPMKVQYVGRVREVVQFKNKLSPIIDFGSVVRRTEPA